MVAGPGHVGRWARGEAAHRGLSTDVGGALVGRFVLQDSVWMDINGYEVTSLAFMAAGGPLWNATGAQGEQVLVSLRAAQEGEELEQRWRAWANLRCPHVVTLLDVARHDDGRWALVMERVPGSTLETLMARGDLRGRTEREAVVQGVESALAALHRAGLVHGDVAPANVVVRPDGSPVLVDLIDGPEAVLGTPGWGVGTGDVAGDLHGLEELARALGVGPGAGAPQGRGPVGVGAEGDEGGADGSSRRSASRLPVMPEASGTVLREVALSAQTRRRDAPARHRRPRPRLLPVLTWACLVGGGVAAAVALTSVLVGSDRDGPGQMIPAVGDAPLPGPLGGGGARTELWPREGPDQMAGRVMDPTVSTTEEAQVRGLAAAVSETTVHALSCPPVEEVADVFEGLVQARDRALERGDRQALADNGHAGDHGSSDEVRKPIGTQDRVEPAGDAEGAGSGDPAERDLAVLAALEASDVRVQNLATHVGDLRELECTGDRIDFTTTLRQLAHQRCTAGRCREVDAGESREVRVRLAGNPWRVVGLLDQP